MMREAWDRGDPWSSHKNTKSDGRYAPALILNSFKKIPSKVAEEVVDAWLMNGVIKTEQRNSSTKLKGLKVLVNEI
jgi:hypothetical protein